MDFLAAADEGTVDHAVADQLPGIADAMSRGGARGRQAVARAADLEGHGEIGRTGTAHDLRNGIGKDLVETARTKRLHCLVVRKRRADTRADDEAGASILDIGLRDPRVVDGMAHGVVGINRSIAHETPELAVDFCFTGDVRNAGHLTVQPERSVFLDESYAGRSVAKGRGDAARIVADA